MADFTVALKFDTSVLEGRVRNAPKRIAFAVVNAINATAKLAQRAVQLRAEDVFTIRKAEFIRRQVAVIKPFANVNQGRAYAEIAVGQKSRLLLPLFEKGGEREPFRGKSIAVPVEARPSKAASVPEELFVKRLGFKRQPATTTEARRRRRKGSVRRSFVGLLGTYLVPKAGIFQRIGRAVSRVLYVFARPFRLRPLLGFEETVREVADRNFARIAGEEVQKALEFRR